VIELGCGVGAMGLALSQICSKVVITDGEESTLEIARLNVGERDNVMVRRLLWGEEGEVERILEEEGTFDLVVGCDLLYYSVDVEELFSCVLRLIETSSSLFFHSHIIRLPQGEEELLKVGNKLGLDHYVIVRNSEEEDEMGFGDVRVMVTCEKGSDLILILDGELELISLQEWISNQQHHLLLEEEEIINNCELGLEEDVMKMVEEEINRSTK